MNIRHMNRGDVRDGGCPMCKPRHKRYEGLVPLGFLVEEGLDEYVEETDNWWAKYEKNSSSG